MSVNAPDAVEVQDFKFLVHSKIKIFDNCEIRANNANLLCAASRFGLIFAGYNNCLKVLQLSSVIQSTLKDQKVPLRTQELQGLITNIAVNCDHTIISITLSLNNTSIIQFYDVTSYYKQTIVLINEVRLSSVPLQISWNPCISNIVAATLEDGTLWSCELNGNAFNLNSTENNIQALSLSWSPKGKQIVVGTKAGTLCQFKPDLKLVKTISITDMKGLITSVQWLSNYQFAATFIDLSDPNNPPCVAIVNSPKSGQTYSVNYEEVCYNSRDCVPKLVNFIHQSAWSILFVFSSNSSEVGLLAGMNTSDVCQWQQWFLMDDARAEIPLVGKDESYMCGYSLDTGNSKQITIGDKTFQPMPMLHILTDRGLLISYDVLNLGNNVNSICCPSEPIRDGSGLSSFILESISDPPKINQPNVSQEPQKFENIIKTSVANQKSNVTLHPSGDFSFLMNNPAITSTPAKSLSPFSQESKDKPTPLSFEKPNLAMEKSTLNSQNLSNMTMLGNTTTIVNNVSFTAAIQSQPKTEAVNNKLNATVQNEGIVGQKTSEYIKDTDKVDHSNISIENEENNDAILCLMQTETSYFFKEFQNVIERSKQIDIKCGTEVESKLLYSGIGDIESFIEEANESTQNLRTEVQSLRQTLIETFSWTNDAKCKTNNNYSSDNDSTYNMEHLQNSADLDLLSKHQLSSITKLLYYVDSQILQLNKQIDEQWSEFQEKCKVRAKGKMHIPSMELLYQTLLKQGDILSKQKQLVQEAFMKIKKKSSTVLLNTNDEVTKLSSMLDLMNMNSRDFQQIQRERILKIKSQFTKSKQHVLLNILSNHKLNRIQPVKIDYNNCKSSIVLDRIRNIKDKKLKPTFTSMKNDFQSELNEYIEKQSTIVQNQIKPQPVIESSKKIDSTFVLSQMNKESQPQITPNLTFAMPTAKSEASAFSILNKSQVVKTDSGLQNFNSSTNQFDIQKPVSLVKGGEVMKDQTRPISFNTLQMENNIGKGNEIAKALSQTIKNSVTITPVNSTKCSSFQFAVPTVSKADGKQITKADNMSAAGMKPATTGSVFSFSLDSSRSPTNANQSADNKTDGFMKDLKICSPNVQTDNSVKNNTFGLSNNSIFGGSNIDGSAAIISNNKEKDISVPNIEINNFISEEVAKTSLSKQTEESNSPVLTSNATITSVIGTSNEDYTKTSVVSTPVISSSTQKTFGTLSSFSFSNTSTKTSCEAPISTVFGQSTTSISNNVTPGIKPINTTGDTTSLTSTTTSTSNSAIVPVTTTISIFSNNVTTGSQLGTAFTSTSTNVQSMPSIFGNTTASESSTSESITKTSANSTVSIAPMTTPNLVFSGNSTVTNSNSIFGGNNVSTTKSSVFGENNVSSTTSSVFGGSGTATSNSLFGASGTTTNSAFDSVNSSTSAFGGNIPNSSSSLTSMFGGGFAITTNSSKSIFGGGGTATTSSVFGGTSSDSSATSVFGGGSTTSTSLFGNPTSIKTTSASIFGGTATSSAVSTPMFGSQTAFGGSPQGSSIFGGNANKPGSNIFGGGALKPATGLFGQQSSFGSASGGSIFGGNSQNSSVFGVATTQSAFGSGFGSPSSGFGNSSTSTFGGGAFSGTSGAASVAQGGFGSPLSVNKPQSGFGSPPAFGSSPSFGAPPSFGSSPSFGTAPTFGSTPAFGSPSNAFSNPAAQTSAFSSPTQQSNTFENLATSNVISFGNLAQSSPQQSNKPASFSGSSSFSSWR